MRAGHGQALVELALCAPVGFNFEDRGPARHLSRARHDFLAQGATIIDQADGLSVVEDGEHAFHGAVCPKRDKGHVEL